MTKEIKTAILETIQKIQGTAEYESSDSPNSSPNSSLEDFLIMQEYSLMRDPARFLILGSRGSGKTRLFYAFRSEKGFQQIMGKQRTLLGPNGTNSEAICGYDANGSFPSQEVLDQFADDRSAKTYWAGSMLFVLLQYFQEDEELLESLQPLLHDGRNDAFFSPDLLKRVSKWLPDLKEDPEYWESLLEKIDAYLQKKDRWLFITYDFLDRVTSEYNSLFPFIRSLLSFWFNHTMRWRRLKCKIFLRTDLYESDMLNFMDASKLNNHVIRLEWNTVSLYRLLIKRMANADSAPTLEYLRKIQGLIGEERDADLGYIPANEKALMEKFVEQIIGRYMGKSPKKGESYRWMPNHLQDANGALAPRSFLKCFSAAAEGMLKHPGEMDKLTQEHLILPAMIQNALVSVSEDRVSELVEEYPWIKKLKGQLEGLTILVNREIFLERIDMSAWEESERKSLPERSSQGIFHVLQKLGIVLIAKDGRVNVPEIYLHGFGMKRKGGLPRNLD